MMRHMIWMAAMTLALCATPVQAGHGHFCWGGWSGVSIGVGSRPIYGYAGRPYYGGFWGGGCYPYGAYYGGWDPHGIYYQPQTGYAEYYLPPVFAPAELLYGPRAVQQFLGINNRPLVLASSDRASGDRRSVRVSNPVYRRKADQFLAQGDMHFRAQKLAQALDRYKAASEMAPDLAEPHWRKGHVYIAMHRYELATAAFKRALAIDPSVARDGFNLSKIYGTGEIAKQGHLEALAGETLVRSDSADHYFLLGVFLRYDGQAERAEKFFLRALDLAGPGGPHLAAFAPVEESSPVAVEIET